MLVHAHQEDVCVVRALCVWRCIQTQPWGIGSLESCHFYLFLSPVCNCRHPNMLYIQIYNFLSSSPFLPQRFHWCRCARPPARLTFGSVSGSLRILFEGNATFMSLKINTTSDIFEGCFMCWNVYIFSKHVIVLVFEQRVLETFSRCSWRNQALLKWQALLYASIFCCCPS